MIPPDEKEVERIANWVAKQTRLFVVFLELGIFGTVVANRSRVGLILCIFYTYFSATWVYAEKILDGLWKEKK
jgi:hypothetical protein